MLRRARVVQYSPLFSRSTELESQLASASDARTRLIVTDGVFSMDGNVAPLADICELAERYSKAHISHLEVA